MTISGEAAYLTADEPEIRIRTWKHVHGFSEADARAHHLDDLRGDFAAGEAHPAGSATVTIDGIARPAERTVVHPYVLSVCRLQEVTVTIATPVAMAMPRLVSRSSS